jgi:hypothetical protein
VSESNDSDTAISFLGTQASCPVLTIVHTAHTHCDKLIDQQSETGWSSKNGTNSGDNVHGLTDVLVLLPPQEVPQLAPLHSSAHTLGLVRLYGMLPGTIQHCLSSSQFTQYLNICYRLRADAQVIFSRVNSAHVYRLLN